MQRVAGLLCCALAAAGSVSKAETLSVVSDQSNVSLGISAGIFLDDEGNPTNPVTGAYYKPGDINPDTGNPVTFQAIGVAIGQSDPGAPALNVTPTLGTGLTTTLNGTVNVTPAGFSIDSANIGLNNSGLWQPGSSDINNPLNAPPVAAEIGAYLDLSGLASGESLIALLHSTQLSLNTSGPLSLDPSGNFIDPNGNLNVVSTTIHGFALGSLNAAIDTTLTNQATSTAFAGSFQSAGGVDTLTLPLSATTYADLSAATQLPGLFVQLTESGTVVATSSVPEPSTMALAGLALIALIPVARRRLRA